MKRYITGWWQTAQEKLSTYPSWVTDIGLYAMSGLICGIIGKNIGRLLIYIVIIAGFVLWLLDYTAYIHVNWQSVRAIFGVPAAQTFDEVIRIYVLWIREHFVSFLSFVFGFFLGWRLG